MLHVHRADRADRLAGALADVLREPLADTFAAEVVAVPTRGVERWVAQQLSSALGVGERADGVCANVVFPAPRRLVDEVVAAASGFDADRDPWLPQRLVWPLLETVDAHLGEPWLAQLHAHLDPGRGDRSRRLRVVAHLAALYDRYALYRPELLNGWQVSSDDDRWQAQLWRALRARVGRPGPAERLEATCRGLRANPELTPLPLRLSLFGLTRLPVSHLEVLRALADGGRDIHLFLLQASPAAWDGVTGVLRGQDAPVARQDVGTVFLPVNPLLASWGREGRELQIVLARAAAETRDTDRGSKDGQDAGRLLGRLQADVRADRMPAAQRGVGADPSVQVHACHGAGRQVEVLRDAVLHALEDDPTLEPRDVIVMCPDIETFAPLIQATFGAGDSDDDDASPGLTGELRVRLADRALRETNPVLGVVARLLELATARVTASEVLDLADREPLRRRFRFAQDDMSRLEEWVAAVGVRWGFDADHRAPFGLQDVAQGTWHAGLDRLLTGVAMTEDEPRQLHGVVPYDDVGSSSIDLAGRFAEYLDRLQATVADFAQPRPIDAWAVALADAADTLTAVSARGAWQRTELQRLLADVVEEATRENATSAALLDVADVAALLERRLAGRPTRANFRTGHLTVCTLQPMRSVPHRVVCLLGLDDTVFPRRLARDGDDLLLEEQQVGDHDARSEDRQILLDALMAATDRLIITYTGNDERTNAERAPAVPVAELLDVIDRTTDGAPVVVRHPLQSFDPVNFEPAALVPDVPWSFDAVGLGGARALVSVRAPRSPFLRGPLARADDAGLIELEQLIAFLGHPVRGFLRQRLGVGATVRTDEIEDGLPLDLDHLALWGIGARLLTAQLRGVDAAGARAVERSRGTLPPGRIGERHLEDIASLVDTVIGAARAAVDLGAEQQTVDVRIALPGERFVRGTISGLAGDVVRDVGFSRISAHQRLGAWARVLALTTAFPERSFSAVTIGRARAGAARNRRVTVARVAPPAALTSADAREAWARDELGKLADLYDRGMREPLPLYCETSAALAALPAVTARRRAEKAWESKFRRPREDRDEEHVLVLGQGRVFDDLVAESPRDDEDWLADEFASRLERYSHRLWDGLLAAEEVTDR
ncbi:MAG TPA: exodeoxyribonuclease V subunit gamma [Solirubrobacteraceae bacterium]|nr:exodeoxyribonuclease V subunit gamma [Solirubrobacteraceae bacterium]